ncbi:phage terminase small subunit [Xenorhabdus griffiniae]|uniref:Phage terminase small subunit n=1 Tax=Xenorhabdus griffiniae TaxID=351672 RepID=A0ABY9XLB5_9GAMM|nr:phage terminase small subunit [Xenorhabdus griffiniae]MBD1229332.1 terminase [Xenorhabdus griffiniae]MBE8588442.1 terminase [Xenorhabdus griffiniae]WMV73629.1 phage terminase small subunit [Xenorhabdus griffiniae]WNH03309.1 phage terminase small subunit [Xenorhabdus griffiniae]
MLSPAQRHRAEVALRQKLARQQAVAIADGASMHLQARAIEQDVKRLRGLLTTAERVEMKRRELLPNYLPTAQRYLDEGEVYSNPIFVYCVIWLFDIGEFDQGLDWADIAIEQGQLTPDHFRSGFPAFVADTVLLWAQREAEAGNPVEPYFSRTFHNVTEKWKVHEKIKAKYYKFAALRLLKGDNADIKASSVDSLDVLAQADSWLATAHQYNPASGVKTYRQRIAARIRALTNETLSLNQ